ncbi:hypothetical protein AZE42_01563 [Rhizopogon vesiculosus]|uniref:Uncharacterized protein n=1 Tax=Rhizopogon vesiculosus TaxID=180088 RepID=A0A1J8QLN0_9AGAM|nr:hypothetical protein AZE42_01563 [Rhizopogon vesiculosus]
MTPNHSQSQPALGVTTEEQDEVTHQLAVQKKPAKVDLLYARNGVVTETSDKELATAYDTRVLGLGHELLVPSLELVQQQQQQQQKRKLTIAWVACNHTIPVSVARSKPKTTTTATRVPLRTDMRGAEDEDDASNDPLDLIRLPEAPASPQRTRRMRAAIALVKEEVNVHVLVPVPGNKTTRRRSGG